ncbi:PriCT-2 domain-containing protein [Acidiphilium sp. C61]|uniref:PriCT-2 domain-containing protein n=1 Tax=Acidiphilium sp. C61 TaxID=1671485 RepID=UPI00157AE75F|nr:PriCT-2 domain-containing protein [Acidiphilium sp. C61]
MGTARRERSDYTDNDVADIVAHLPADTGYDDWVAVLSAIYRATGGSARGRDLAHEYSRKSPAYRHRSVDEKWCAFRHGGALRHDFGHLLNRVKEAEPGYLTPSFRAKLSSARLEHAPASAGVPPIRSSWTLISDDPGAVREAYRGGLRSDCCEVERG